MEQHDTEDSTLIIPENSPPVKYVINGFTAIDISYVGFIGFLGLIIAIILYIKTGNIVKSLFLFIFTVVVAAMIFSRDIYTENMIDKLKILIKYKRMPKKYEYEYVNIYENSKGMNKQYGEKGKREG